MTYSEYLVEFFRRFGRYEGKRRDGDTVGHVGLVGTTRFLWMDVPLRVWRHDPGDGNRWAEITRVDGDIFRSTLTKAQSALAGNYIEVGEAALSVGLSLIFPSADILVVPDGLLRVRFKRCLFGLPGITVDVEWDTKDQRAVRLACEHAMGESAPLADWLLDNVPGLADASRGKGGAE